MLYLSGHTDSQDNWFLSTVSTGLSILEDIHGGGGVAPDSPSWIPKLPAHAESWRSSTQASLKWWNFPPPRLITNCFSLGTFILCSNNYYSIQPTERVARPLPSDLREMSGLTQEVVYSWHSCGTLQVPEQSRIAFSGNAITILNNLCYIEVF